MSTRFYANQIDYIAQLNAMDDATAVVNDVVSSSTVYPVFSTTGATGGLLKAATTKISFVPSTGILSVVGLTLTTALSATNGGTGKTSYAIGDLLYADTTTSLASLAGVATTNVLRSGGVGAAPAWGKVVMSTDVSGTLGVTNGGTGKNSIYTQWGIVYAAATTALSSTAAGTTGQFLRATTSGAPVWVALQTPDATVAGLATANTTNRGMRAHVTDSTVAASGNYGATVVGGGTNVVPVFCTGTAWIIA